jgi:VIT1/CCC1 family predicted Fe2+/Mn2+ transporter
MVYPCRSVTISLPKPKPLDKKNPNNEAIRTATATFVSFIVLGWFPMIPYIVHILRPEITQTDIFIASSIITWLVFILIGWTKAKITKTPLPSSILQTFGLGTVAAVLAYYVGSVLEKIVGG